MRSILTVLVLGGLTSTAWAQGVQDLDGDSRSAGKTRAKDFENVIVREVERGTFMKAGMGTQQYIAAFSGILRPVIGLNLAVGSDVVDNENLSVAVEFDVSQSLQNGPKFDVLGSLPDTNKIQGDIHTFATVVLGEVSFYPTKRFGIGVRAGGGVMFVPKLMDADAYSQQVVLETWGLAEGPSIHEGPQPMVAGGPTIEYYTKLSHFSLGLDVDVYYVINFDLAVAPNGYVKYTF
ncbi:MAG: hypothetical protein ACI9KE_004117 [Polyangiales bacterium]|jgi:hypothetical protein